MMRNYKPPTWQAKAFNCPHCGVLVPQRWTSLYIDGDEDTLPASRDRYHIHKGFYAYYDLRLSVCGNCCKESIWHGIRMFYPSVESVEPANPDLPEDIKKDYLEAASIVQRSPRGAAALLRLCVQKLCKHLGQPGNDINKDIGALVAGGLSPRIQQALDIVRVVGNEAVHPGVLDLKDDFATAVSLFGLLNMIAEYQISRPQQLDALYNNLPQSKLEGIKQRDKAT